MVQDATYIWGSNPEQFGLELNTLTTACSFPLNPVENTKVDTPNLFGFSRASLTFRKVFEDGLAGTAKDGPVIICFRRTENDKLADPDW